MKSIFSDISYKHLKTLLSVIDGANDKTLERVETLYQRKGTKFARTLEFARGIKLVSVRNGRVNNRRTIQENMSRLSDEQLKTTVVNLVLNSKKAFRKETQSYFGNFQFAKTTYVFEPKTSKRFEYSEIRNFLVELGLIKYDSTNRIYSIAPKHFSRFVKGREDTPLHPDALKIVLKKKEQLGKAAEEAVIDYERERLTNYPEFVERIEHVASKNVMAGYDIKSWEVRNKKSDRLTERYIEVKAVALDEVKFYWSKNEIAEAKKRRRKYCLYLVPVVSDKKFDMEGLEIIHDPFVEVLTGNDWEKQVESYSFTKNR